jgi:hypothetical protein
VTRRPFDPGEIGAADGDRDPELERTAAELLRYRDLTAEPPAAGFADRVMAAVEREPAPGRGLLAWLAGARAWQQPLRAVALAAVVVLAVGGALVAGEISGIIRQGPQTGTSPAPLVTLTPSPAPTTEPTEPSSETPEPSESPGTAEPSGSPEPSDSPGPAGGETETPRPTRTASPSASPSDHETETPQPSPSSSASDG